MSAFTQKTGGGPTGPLLSLVQGLTRVLDWSGQVIAVICLAAMFVLLFVNVLLRYLLGDGIPWAYEIHAILLPWLVAGGVVIAAARGRNISITLLPDLFGAGWTRAFVLVVSLVIFVICATVLYTGQPTLRAASFQTLATLGIKQVWGYASLIYAFGGMGLIALMDATRAMLGDMIKTNTSLS